MNIKYRNKKIILCAVGSFFLLACGPKEEKPAEAKTEQMKSKQAPAATPLSSENPALKNEKGLTPQQKEELKINEDNVMNPFPG